MTHRFPSFSANTEAKTQAIETMQDTIAAVRATLGEPAGVRTQLRFSHLRHGQLFKMAAGRLILKKTSDDVCHVYGEPQARPLLIGHAVWVIPLNEVPS